MWRPRLRPWVEVSEPGRWRCLVGPDGGRHSRARLRASGAVILGKTNMPAFAGDDTRADSSWAGPTKNAVDPEVAPGASSTGTATAVAASFAVMGLAGGNRRINPEPCAAQSLVSIKPTFALVPNTGVAPMASSTRDVVGVHAKTVHDAAMLLPGDCGLSLDDPKTVGSIGHALPDTKAISGLSAGVGCARRANWTIGPGWRRDADERGDCCAL